MIRIHTVSELRALVSDARKSGREIGLVPTMGFLHEGHMALVRASKQNNNFTVVSVFVNPLQFGPNEDYSRYPRDLEHDATLLEQHDCDVLFAPAVEEMYPLPMVTHVDLPSFSEYLCGASRPGHFRGVATVVSKLFNIVGPDKAYFGQKDGQQVAVLKRMVVDLNFPLEIVTVPIVRENDGLAKSSRNIFLQGADRENATALYRSLSWANEQIENGTRDTATILKGMREILERTPGIRVDYVEAVDMNTMRPIETLRGDLMIAVAAFVGSTRLIDNIQLQFEVRN